LVACFDITAGPLEYFDPTATTGVTGRVLTAAATNAHNTFDQPAVVKAAAFTGATIESGSLKATLPPKSVVMLDLK
jgi:alpha-N-arabinofuranosidase